MGVVGLKVTGEVGLIKNLMPLYRRSRQPVLELSALSLVLVPRARPLARLHLEQGKRRDKPDSASVILRVFAVDWYSPFTTKTRRRKESPGTIGGREGAHKVHNSVKFASGP